MRIEIKNTAVFLYSLSIGILAGIHTYYTVGEPISIFLLAFLGNYFCITILKGVENEN